MSRRKLSLKELNLHNAESWPREYKLGLCVLLGLLIITLAWSLFVRDQREQLDALVRQESELRAIYVEERGKAANLRPLTLQLGQMEQQLQQMLRQLPSKTEMPDLIVDVSQTALATGLASELFQPGQEAPREFYAEKPIALRMVGTYHQFGAFVSGVASLPRVVILTMHDIALQPKDPKAGITADSQVLELAGTVKTYRYLDEDEAAAQAASAKASAPNVSVQDASGQNASGQNQGGVP